MICPQKGLVQNILLVKENIKHGLTMYLVRSTYIIAYKAVVYYMNLNVSDHLPVYITIRLSKIQFIENKTENLVLSNVKWHKCTEDHLQTYTELCEQVFNRHDIELSKSEDTNSCVDLLLKTIKEIGQSTLKVGNKRKKGNHFGAKNYQICRKLKKMHMINGSKLVSQLTLRIPSILITNTQKNYFDLNYVSARLNIEPKLIRLLMKIKI